MNMNLTIFWTSLLLLLKLPAGVFTRPINIGPDHLGKPMWIMSKAGDQMPDNNNPALRYNSFDDNKNTIQPFINWNGELKMVVPIHRSSGITRKVIPDVYNWDTLPCFRNNPISHGCEYCDNSGENDGNRFEKILLIATCLLVIFLGAYIILCSCQHGPECHILKDKDECCETISSRNTDSRSENMACIILCSCLTCQHRPGCHNLKDEDECCKTISSSSTDSR